MLPTMRLALQLLALAAVLLLAAPSSHAHASDSKWEDGALSPAEWAGTYEGACVQKVALDLEAPELGAQCLPSGRVMALPFVATWAVDGKGKLSYSYSEDNATTVPAAGGATLFLPGGLDASVSVGTWRTKHSRQASRCVNVTYNGYQAVFRASVVRQGASAVYTEEGYYTLVPAPAPMTVCPPLDQGPLLCNSTMVSYRCTAARLLGHHANNKTHGHAHGHAHTHRLRHRLAKSA